MYEALIAHLRECAKLDPSNNTYKEAADAIEELVRNVVRCKDCTYSKIIRYVGNTPKLICTKHDTLICENDFCSYGLRKGEETDGENEE